MKFYVYPNDVYTDADFDEMCGDTGWPQHMSDDYWLVDTFWLESNACLALNNHETPDTWHLIRMETTPHEDLEHTDPVTTRVFEVPIQANGNAFTAIAVVTYDHLYHTRDVEWFESLSDYRATNSHA